MRTALTIAGAALVLGSLAGCGGSDSGGGSDDSMPTSASTEEFCGNFADLQESLTSLGADAEPADAVAALQDAADQMAETGVPEDATDQEAGGLQATIEAIQSLGDDATLEDISNLESTLSEEAKTDAEAFDAYLQKTCPELG